jgi:dolichol kinase
VAAVVCAVVFWSPLDAVAVGIGAVSFISTFLLATGPLSSSFTFAEAVIAADGVAGLVMVATGAALGMESLPRSNIGIAVLAVLLGIVSMVALSVVSAWSQYRPGAPLPTLTIAHFLAIVGASGFLVVLPFMHFHGVLFWTLEFVFRLDHLVVLGIWGVAVVGTVTVLRGFVESRVPRIVARKLYHALAVAIFLPSAVHRLELLQFSLAVAAFLLIALEIYRAFKVEPLHDLIEGFMASQIDSRDGGNVILTHLYLLFGCAVPVWLAGASPNPLAPLAGVLMIGIGDSMASAVGKWKGKTPWPGTRKTIEGTAAAFLSVAAVQWWLCRGQALGVGLGLGLGLECGQPTWTRTAFELLAVALVCILEAFTSQIDNILLPIVLASSLNFAASG